MWKGANGKRGNCASSIKYRPHGAATSMIWGDKRAEGGEDMQRPVAAGVDPGEGKLRQTLQANSGTAAWDAPTSIPEFLTAQTPSPA